jgi:hypothetical protein
LVPAQGGDLRQALPRDPESLAKAPARSRSLDPVKTDPELSRAVSGIVKIASIDELMDDAR